MPRLSDFTPKHVAIGCGAFAGTFAFLCLAGLVWLGSTGEDHSSGVLLANQVDPYALEYMKRHRMLEDGEQLRAYYDASMDLDGSEAAVITDQRLIYHNGGRSTSVPLREVTCIRHSDGALGDVFEAETGSGRTVRVEVAPLNGGSVFRRALLRARDAAQGGSATVKPGCI